MSTFVFTVERCHRTWAAGLYCVGWRVEPKAQMIGLYRVCRSIWECPGEDHWCRRHARTDDKGFNAEAASEMLEGVAFVISIDVSLIPRQPKRCGWNLDHEEVETGVGRQTGSE